MTTQYLVHSRLVERQYLFAAGAVTALVVMVIDEHQCVMTRVHTPACGTATQLHFVYKMQSIISHVQNHQHALLLRQIYSLGLSACTTP